MLSQISIITHSYFTCGLIHIACHITIHIVYIKDFITLAISGNLSHQYQLLILQQVNQQHIQHINSLLSIVVCFTHNALITGIALTAYLLSLHIKAFKLHTMIHKGFLHHIKTYKVHIEAYKEFLYHIKAYTRFFLIQRHITVLFT